MKLKSKPVFLVGICVLFVITSLGIFSEKLNATEVNSSTEFLEILEDKVRYLIFDEPEGFRDSLIAQSDPNVFDHNYLPARYADADLIIFFFNDWSEAKKIPGAENLGSMIDGVAKLSDTLAKFITITANGPKGPRPVIFGFYNLENLKGCSPEAFARHVIHDVTIGYKDGDKNVLGGCAN